MIGTCKIDVCDRCGWAVGPLLAVGSLQLAGAARWWLFPAGGDSGSSFCLWGKLVPAKPGGQDLESGNLGNNWKST
jgi:hypothetical protein